MAANLNEIDMDINNYNNDELLELLDLDHNLDSKVLMENIDKKTDELIKDCIAQDKADLADFFLNVKKMFMDKLNQSITHSESSSDSFNGNILNIDKLLHILNIDSRFRYNYENTSSTNFEINLPQKLYNVCELTLASLELPNTYYVFADEYFNNYLWIKYTNTSNVISYVYIYISDGNYYYDNIISQINTDFTTLDIPLTISYDYDTSSGSPQGTGRVTISINTGVASYLTYSSFEINLNASPYPDATESAIYTDSTYYDSTLDSDNRIDYTFGWKLGYRTALLTGLDSYVSKGILDFSGFRYLYLSIDDFNSNSNLNNYSSSKYGLLDPNIIARITLAGAVFALQTQTDYSVFTDPRIYFGPVHLEKLKIRVYNEFLQIINLNEIDISLTLKVKCLYHVPSQIINAEQNATDQYFNSS